MPGIDKTLITDQNEETVDLFCCDICGDILSDPVMTACCRKPFCSECISSSIGSSEFCPNCRSDLKQNNLVPVSITLKNFIFNMRAKCQFHDSGCAEALKLSDFSEHILYCQSNPEKHCIRCKHKDIDGHNCIENLNKDILRLKKEISDLKSEINGKSSEQKMLDIITNVRQHIGDEIDENVFEISIQSPLEDELEVNMKSGLVEVCRVGINSFTKFDGLVEHIKDTLAMEETYSSFKWAVVVKSGDCLTEVMSTQSVDITFSAQFVDLYIQLFGVNIENY